MRFGPVMEMRVERRRRPLRPAEVGARMGGRIEGGSSLYIHEEGRDECHANDMTFWISYIYPFG